MKKYRWIILAAVSAFFIMSAVIACDKTPEGTGGEGGGSTPIPPVEKGNVTGVTLLLDGQPADDTLSLTFDDNPEALNEYTFSVRVDKTGEVDEVDEMVFWTSDNPAVASLMDNETSATVKLTGKKGKVTITVYSLLYSDSLFDSITLDIKIPVYPMATVTALETYKLEAENADLTECAYGGTKPDGTIIEETTNSTSGGKYEASGGKVIGNLNKKGNKISFCVTSEKPAKVQMSLMLAASTYRSNDSGNMSIPFDDVAKVTVNDTEIKTKINFNVYSTDTWYKYEAYACEGEISLDAGANFIVIEVKTDASPTNTNTKMPNIDYMTLKVVEYDGQRPAARVDSVTLTKDGNPAADKEIAVYMSGSETITFGADVQVTGDISRNVTWSSNNETVATVNNGVVTMKGKSGTVTIIAASEADPGYSDSITLEVVVPHAVISADGTFRMEAEDSIIKGGKVETISSANKSKIRLYTPGTEYKDAEAYEVSGGKNTSLGGAGSYTYYVWSDTTRDTTLKMCFAPSANNKSNVYRYGLDNILKVDVDGVRVTTGITVSIPDKATTDATGIGCYFYYTVYTSAQNVSLKAGLNKIVFNLTGDGYKNETRGPNFDYIELIAGEAA